MWLREIKSSFTQFTSGSVSASGHCSSSNEFLVYFYLPCKRRRGTGEEREMMMRCKSFKVVRTLNFKAADKRQITNAKAFYFIFSRILNNFGMWKSSFVVGRHPLYFLTYIQVCSCMWPPRSAKWL